MSTKRQRRREAMLDEHWLKFHGNTANPRHKVRQFKRQTKRR